MAGKFAVYLWISSAGVLLQMVFVIIYRHLYSEIGVKLDGDQILDADLVLYL